MPNNDNALHMYHRMKRIVPGTGAGVGAGAMEVGI